jgi:hypothetical protein
MFTNLRTRLNRSRQLSSSPPSSSIRSSNTLDRPNNLPIPSIPISLPKPQELFEGVKDTINTLKDSSVTFTNNIQKSVSDFTEEQTKSVLNWGENAIVEAKEGVQGVLNDGTMDIFKQLGDWMKWIFLGGLRKWLADNAMYFYIGGSAFLLLFIYLVIRKISSVGQKMITK